MGFYCMYVLGVKPYACPVCGCRFHLLHNMKRHIRTHEEQGDIEVGTADGLIKAAETTISQVSCNLGCIILISRVDYIQVVKIIFD